MVVTVNLLRSKINLKPFTNKLSYHLHLFDLKLSITAKLLPLFVQYEFLHEEKGDN